MSRSIAVVVLAIWLLFVAAGAESAWLQLTEQELISQSSVIVTGTLIGETRVAHWDDLIIGVIRIDRVLKGDATQKIALLMLRPAEGPSVSTQLNYQIGQRGLWFLRDRQPGEAGLYVADHPQRFVTDEDAAAFIERIVD